MSDSITQALREKISEAAKQVEQREPELKFLHIVALPPSAPTYLIPVFNWWGGHINHMRFTSSMIENVTVDQIAQMILRSAFGDVINQLPPEERIANPIVERCGWPFWVALRSVNPGLGQQTYIQYVSKKHVRWEFHGMHGEVQISEYAREWVGEENMLYVDSIFLGYAPDIDRLFIYQENYQS